MFEISTDVRVRFAETDAMGIVYHSNYLIWFEVARIKLLDSLDIAYKKFQDEGLFIPVLEAFVQYKKPAKFDDIVTIRAFIDEKPRVKIKINYELFVNGQKIVTGHTLHAFMNTKGLPIKPPAAFNEAMNKINL